MIPDLPCRLRQEAAEWDDSLASEHSVHSLLLEAANEINRLRDLLRGFRAHYGDPEWHDMVMAELGPMSPHAVTKR